MSHDNPHKTLLLIGAGIEAIPGIQRAKALGLQVVVSDRDPDAPGVRHADGFLHADTYDPEATAKAAREFSTCDRPIHGVLTIAADVPHTVAATAKALGLPGIGCKVAARAIDKLAMKKRLVAGGVPVPWFAPVASVEELRDIVEAKGWPLVLKPVDSRGSRGVLLLSADIDLSWAFATSRRFSPTGRVMIERFLDGPQVSTETVMLDGAGYTPGFSDRNYGLLERYAPHIIEDGGELPSYLSEQIQEDVRRTAERAALSLGIERGTAKGDIVIHQGRAHVIEMAARLSGGYFCSHEIPLNTGVDFVGAAIRLALGEDVDPQTLVPRFQQSVAQRYFFPRPGRVTRVEVPAWIADDPAVALCEVRVQPGDLVAPIDSHPARGGVVIALGEDRAAARNKAEAVVEAVHIETVMQ